MAGRTWHPIFPGKSGDGLRRMTIDEKQPRQNEQKQQSVTQAGTPGRKVSREQPFHTASSERVSTRSPTTSSRQRSGSSFNHVRECVGNTQHGRALAPQSKSLLRRNCSTVPTESSSETPRHRSLPKNPVPEPGGMLLPFWVAMQEFSLIHQKEFSALIGCTVKVPAAPPA